MNLMLSFTEKGVDDSGQTAASLIRLLLFWYFLVSSECKAEESLDLDGCIIFSMTKEVRPNTFLKKHANLLVIQDFQ